MVGTSRGEEGLKVLLPGGVRGKGMAGQPLTLGVELDEPLGHILGGLFGLGLGLLPLRAPQLGQALAPGVVPAADVFGHQVQLEGGDVEDVGAGKLQLDVVPVRPVHRHLHHAHKPADAVVLVDHQVPGGQVGEGFQPLAGGGVRLGPASSGGSGGQGLPLRQNGKLSVGEVKARRQPPHGDGDPAGGGQVVEALVHGGEHPFLPQHGLKGVGLPPAGGQEHHGKVLLLVLQQVLRHRRKADAVARQLPGGEGEQGRWGHRRRTGGEGVQVEQGPGGQAGAQGLKGRGQHRWLAGEQPLLQ